MTIKRFAAFYMCGPTTRRHNDQNDKEAFSHRIAHVWQSPTKKKSVPYATEQVMSAPQHIGDLIFPQLSSLGHQDT
jgi:hypothetical protein